MRQNDVGSCFAAGVPYCAELNAVIQRLQLICVSAYSDSPVPWREISPRLSRLGGRAATFYKLPGNPVDRPGPYWGPFMTDAIHCTYAGVNLV
jgi:hypothetical protein